MADSDDDDDDEDDATTPLSCSHLEGVQSETRSPTGTCSHSLVPN
jgi:hypothetical protein